MEVVLVRSVLFILIVIPLIGFGWFFDLEMSTSTSMQTSWVEVNLKYDYMEIGREKNGILSIEIKNKTKDFLKLKGIVSNVRIFMSPSSPVEYPVDIPPMSVITLTSFSTPVNMRFEFVFERGKIEGDFPVALDYKEEKKEMFKKHLTMLTNFLVAMFIFFLVKGMVNR